MSHEMLGLASAHTDGEWRLPAEVNAAPEVPVSARTGAGSPKRIPDTRSVDSATSVKSPVLSPPAAAPIYRSRDKYGLRTMFPRWTAPKPERDVLAALPSGAFKIWRK